MKEMWTGIYPNKKEYKYEVRFRTDNEYAYKLVQKACQEAIDIDFSKKTATSEKKTEADAFRWLRINNTVYDIIKTPIVEFECECGIITHQFDTQFMINNWNTAGIFTCSECKRRIIYEFLK